MDDFAGGMLGILPPLVIGGAALMLTDRFIRQPMQEQERTRSRRRHFDKQEYRDSKPRGRGMGFGDFRNIGW